MLIYDILASLEITLLITAIIFVVLINSEYLKRKLTKKQRFILEITTDIVIISFGIYTYVILIYFLNISPYSLDAITIAIGIFGIIVIMISEIVRHQRRKNKLQKVKDNFTEVDWKKGRKP